MLGTRNSASVGPRAGAARRRPAGATLGRPSGRPSRRRIGFGLDHPFHPAYPGRGPSATEKESGQVGSLKWATVLTYAGREYSKSASGRLLGPEPALSGVCRSASESAAKCTESRTTLVLSNGPGSWKEPSSRLEKPDGQGTEAEDTIQRSHRTPRARSPPIITPAVQIRSRIRRRRLMSGCLRRPLALHRLGVADRRAQASAGSASRAAAEFRHRRGRDDYRKECATSGLRPPSLRPEGTGSALRSYRLSWTTLSRHRAASSVRPVAS